MKKISLLISSITLALSLNACGGDEVQIVLVNQMVNPEMRSSMVQNSSRICTQLNEEGISCQVKLNSMGKRPLLIKMFKGGQKTEITEFGDESELMNTIKSHMK